jgi:POT family proton-dependent oligopeptide transporter
VTAENAFPLHVSLSGTLTVVKDVLLTFGEVLVATTGLEFAYSQAPLSMKGAIMAFWNLSVTIGNLWVLVANAGLQNSAVTTLITSAGFDVTVFQMVLLRCIASAAALAFGRAAHLPTFRTTRKRALPLIMRS